jgi:hypothetical protein
VFVKAVGDPLGSLPDPVTSLTATVFVVEKVPKVAEATVVPLVFVVPISALEEFCRYTCMEFPVRLPPW